MILRETEATAEIVQISPSQAVGEHHETAPAGRRAKPVRAKSNARVAAAVLGYIKAVRSLGHTRINTSDIADALNLSHREVLEAVRKLGDKGVKPL